MAGLVPAGLAWLLWLLAGCAGVGPSSPTTPAAAQAPPSAALLPEGATGVTAKAEARGGRFMVAAAHPLATEAGVSVLQRGGSAVDAAVAVQAVLTLVEPQASGIGGGAFALHWDGRQVQAWDGRETAPAAADERMFVGPDGRALPFDQVAAGGRAVGVPGVLRMLEALHREHGRLAWATLFEPAITLAEQGFAVGPRMHALLRADQPLKADRRAAAYFYRADGEPHAVGHRLRNPALAAVLRQIARHGAAAFYAGAVASDMAARVQGAAPPGRLTPADLAGYEALRREAICTDWGERWRVCGFPPPSSGHLAVMQILGLLQVVTQAEPPPLAQGVPTADWLHLYTEAARLAFADRARYVADPAFVAAPGGDWRSLLAPEYLAQRAQRIGPRAMPVAPAGVPAADAVAWADAPPQPEAGTSQLSIVDGDGRAISMTTSIQTAWGSRLLVDGGTGLPGGFLLNNQLTDFAFVPADASGALVANRVQPGKRPRSSMSPTLVFERHDGGLRLVAGSALGAMIIHATAKVLLGTLPWSLGLQTAVDMPNFGIVDGPLLLERGRFAPQVPEALRARGHQVVEAELPTGLQLVGREGSGWVGATDPRREGVARGE